MGRLANVSKVLDQMSKHNWESCAPISGLHNTHKHTYQCIYAQKGNPSSTTMSHLFSERMGYLCTIYDPQVVWSSCGVCVCMIWYNVCLPVSLCPCVCVCVYTRVCSVCVCVCMCVRVRVWVHECVKCVYLVR